MSDWPKFCETGEKETCCGCTACEEVCPVRAIRMQRDEEGFLYPQIDEAACIHCKRCKQVCPFGTYTYFTTPKSAWAAVHKDNNVLAKSSSGGAFTAFSDVVLEKNGFVAGAVLQDNVVRHCLTNSKAQAARMRGSKYVQSELANTIQQIKGKIDEGEFVLFTGTPCQCAGVRNAVGGTDNLVTLDFVCHGVPSPAVWQEYVAYKEELSNEKICFLGFRAKFAHKMGYYETFRTAGNQVCNLPAYESPFLTGFLKGILSRPSCYNCPYSQQQRASDLTICDYWGYSKQHSQFNPEKGISAVLVNSQRGEKLLEEAAPQLHIHPTTLEQVTQDNENLKRTTEMPAARAAFFSDRKQYSFDVLAQRYLQDPQAVQKKLKDRIPYPVKNLMKKFRGLIK